MSNFPTILETLAVDKAASTPVGPTDHPQHHNDLARVVNSLQAKVGADSSLVNTSHDFKLGEITGSDKAVGKSASQVLTNKTISGGSNTISGITEAMLSLSDVTTYDVSTSRHGFVPKAPNDSTKFLNGLGQFAVPAATVSSVIQSFTAGESISAGDAVMVADGNDVAVSTTMRNLTSGTSKNNSGSLSNWYAQSFTTSSTTTKIQRCAIEVGSPFSVPTGTLHIKSSLTGSSLGSGGYSPNASPSQVINVTFTGGVTVTPNTVYYIVFQPTNTNQITVWGSSSSSYAGGQGYQSTDGGANWVSSTGVLDFYFEISEAITVAGYVYKADNNRDTQFYTQFIGFANSGATVGNSCTVTVAGVMSGLSGLVAGTHYYLSDTGGQIQTAGSNKKVGLALTSTTLLIKNENL